ncbi:MAG: hypothetical protein COV10_04580 [Candidatus Vogelbacteria bacterium CG10_big_fil_rev_8_21_14_0_10_51_16]|uniref:Uncharacterized protein n=1 Tax=Candidatus Vogelbacteria bacterium CG10_big_fil_rev_8_21_14_0_10_51_16 TaxID=1975045 RepID=A0A2H0RDA8_9BACT|nr:MAG: hypothetical protein COV10_04580 [Candidatus Vogelbacteria bacterium CG10_big_fil_rev_8_21_14_0_10_51_16]
MLETHHSQHETEDAISSRWESYRRANTESPGARENELSEIFKLLNPQHGEKVWEYGTGNRYLTFPLAQAVGSIGEVISTDVNEGNTEEVKGKAAERSLPIKTILLAQENPFLPPEYQDYFDAVTSIATLHHLDNRDQQTGMTGRLEGLKKFYASLKRGGRLVIADPVYGTATQRYFDSIDDPEYCYPTGHPHDFPTQDEILTLITKAGFTPQSLEVKTVPWRFPDIEAAKKFVHTIHHARAGADQSLVMAEKILGLTKVGDHYELGWQLFFLKAVRDY